MFFLIQTSKFNQKSKSLFVELEHNDNTYNNFTYNGNTYDDTKLGNNA